MRSARSAELVGAQPVTVQAAEVSQASATGVTESGAEKLEGKGDFLLVAKGSTVRFQAAWLGPDDLGQVCQVLRQGIRGLRSWSDPPPARPAFLHS